MQYDHPTDSSPALTADELGRLERHAALTVLSEVDDINGTELNFARKAQPARTHGDRTLRAKAS